MLDPHIGFDVAAQVGELVDVMRDDEVKLSFDPEEALANAPSREGSYFRVRAMQE